MIEEKKCPRCGVTKPFSEFGKCTNNKNGINTYCKYCWNLIAKELRSNTYIRKGHCKGIESPSGKRRFTEHKIEKNRNHDTCITLHIHSDMMKDDPEHLTTDFMQKILGRKCE